MARRKKHHAPKRRRHRRMGSVSTGFMSDIEEAGGIVFGSVLAASLQRHVHAVPQKIMSAGQVLGGFMLRKKATGPIMRGISYGFIATGSMGLVHEFGVIHGIDDLVAGMYDGDMGLMEDTEMRGIDNRDFVAGIDNRSYVAGADGPTMFNPEAYAVGM